MVFSFFKNSLICVNILTLLAQLILMGSTGYFFDFPLLTLMVPLICLFNLILFIYWLFRMQWPFILFIGALLIGISEWGLLYQLPNNAINTSKGVKIMSFNVRLFNTYGWIARDDIPQAIQNFITDEAPEIICFQEYSEKLAPKLLKYPHRYFISTRTSNYVGPAIFSKRPLYNTGNIHFVNSTNGGIYANFIHQKDTLRVFNVHFESLRINLRDTLITEQPSNELKTRMRQVIKKQNEQVSFFNNVASEASYPSIVCTDLNNNAFSNIYRAVSQGRKDAFVSAGRGMGTSYRFSYFPLRIDFIFTDPKVKIYGFKTHSLGLSDHAPITAEIDWP